MVHDGENIMIILSSPSGVGKTTFAKYFINHFNQKFKKKISSEINLTSSNDPRSYRQNSDKLLATGFKQKFKVDDAIDEIARKFRAGELADKEIFYNVKIMKKLFN